MNKKKSVCHQQILKNSGFSLMDVLVVVAIVAILMILLAVYLSPQLVKSYDGRRKSDLNKIKIAYEDYYNDYSCYPPVDTLEKYCNSHNDVLDDYLKNVPCDPETGQAYLYMPAPHSSNTCGGFRLFTKLGDKQDKVIAQIHCNNIDGCGLGTGFEDYNYGVSQGVPIYCDADSCDTSTLLVLAEARWTPTPVVGDGSGSSEVSTTPTPSSSPQLTSTPTPTTSSLPTPTPTPTPISPAYALNFSGTVPNGIMISNNTTDLNFDLGDTISLSAWIKPTDLILNRQEGIVSKGNDDFPKNFRLFLGGTGDGVGRLQFSYIDNTAPQANEWARSVFSSDVEITENQTYYVAFSYTYGEPSSAKLYLNGLPVSGSWINGDGASRPAQTTQSITVGGDTNAALNELFSGVIDEVKVYTTILSDAQVADSYNQGAGTPSVAEPGLIAGWNFNEGSGTTITDFSGNNRDGVLINGAQTWVPGLITY